MKKLLILLFTLSLGASVKAQYMTVPTHYEAEHTAKSILAGNLNDFTTDSVEFVVERGNERYVSNYGLSKKELKSKVEKVFAKGNPEYSSRTNGGYVFTIAVVDFKDETKVLNYCTFHVDAFTQKIEKIEILLGE